MNQSLVKQSHRLTTAPAESYWPITHSGVSPSTAWAHSDRGPIRVYILLFNGFNHHSLSSIIEPLRVANYLADDSIYQAALVSAEGGTISSGCMSVATERCSDIPASRIDMLFLCDQQDIQDEPPYRSSDLKDWIGSSAAGARVVTAIGRSVFSLASLGLLLGRKVTVPWQAATAFADKYPDCDLLSSIFETDGNFVTCAGGASTVDFLLQLISARCGSLFTSAVADYLIFGKARAPGARQRPLSYSVPASKVLAEALKVMERSPEKSAADVASQVGISRRQLERLCQQHLGCAPARMIMMLRLDRSRVMLRGSTQSVTSIRCACGFATTSHFSKLYKRRFGVSPNRDRAAVAGHLKSPAAI